MYKRLKFSILLDIYFTNNSNSFKNSDILSAHHMHKLR